MKYVATWECVQCGELRDQVLDEGFVLVGCRPLAYRCACSIDIDGDAVHTDHLFGGIVPLNERIGMDRGDSYFLKRSNGRTDLLGFSRWCPEVTERAVEMIGTA